MTLYIYKPSDGNLVHFPKTYDEPLAGVEQMQALALSVAKLEDLYVIQNGAHVVDHGKVQNLVVSSLDSEA